MVFQNKPNVAQYFVIFFAFMLSFLFCSNANAYELITAEYVKSFSFTTYGNAPYGNVQYSYDLDSTFTSPFMTFEVPPNGKVAFNILRLKLRSQKVFKRTEKFKFDMIFYDYSTAINNLSFSFPACPKGSNDFIITSCSYEVLDSSNPIQFPTSFPTSITQNSSIYYTVLHIEGTRRNSDITTDTISLTTDGFYNIKNFTDAISQTHNIGIHFSAVDIYKDDSAEEEVAEKELESTTNIENQTSQNTTGGSSESQQTTNLIGVFSGFLSQLQSFSATNCNLDLPFPAFIGGTQTVNICQGKDVLGNFITIVGTLAMLTFYIPLAFVLLKMIYNEIRSFTNG